MAERTIKDLSGVPETLLLTVYVRAKESQRPDALLNDEKAVALVTQWEQDFLQRIRQLKIDEDDRVTLVLRNREFDRHARDFLAAHPDAVVVHFGCGFDSRFDRVDNGQVEWYDLDVPEVIGLRRKFVDDEGPRHHFLACSAFDTTWLNSVETHQQRPFLFLAEGVLMYFDEAEIKSLILTLRQRFPGAELVFDAFSPYLVRANNVRFARAKLGARYHWALKHGKDLESWADGIRLLDEWFPFSRPEPRLAHIRWMRFIPFLARVMGIFHYQLGAR